MLEVPLDDSLRGGADLEVDTVADVTSSLCFLNNIDFYYFVGNLEKLYRWMDWAFSSEY